MGKVVKSVGKFIGKVFKAGLGLVGMLFSPPKTPKASANAATETRLNVTLVPEENRKIVFGETALGTDLRFWETFGSKNERHVQIIAAAGHAIESFGNLYIDEIPVPLDPFQPVPGNKYSGALIRYVVTKGVKGSAPSFGSGTRWNSTASFHGCAYFVLEWIYSQEKLTNGIPSRITQVGKGAKVYDPRRDSTRGGVGSHRADNPDTWEYAPTDSNGVPIGRNNALQMLTYQLGLFVRKPNGNTEYKKAEGGNQGFEEGLTGWHSGVAPTVTGTPLSAAYGTHYTSYEGASGVFVTTAGTRRDTVTEKLFPVDTARKYRIRTRFFVGPDAPVQVYVGMSSRLADGSAAFSNAGLSYPVVNAQIFPAGTGWVERVSGIITGESAEGGTGETNKFRFGTKFVRLIALLNFRSTPGGQVALDGIWLEEVIENPLVLVGGRGVDPDDIDFDSFITAANYCEVYRWYSDCVLSTGDTHSTNEGILEAAAGGQLVDVGGRFSYYVAADDTANAVVYLDENDIVGDIDWEPQPSLSEQFNELPGTFVDPSSLFQTRPLPMAFDQAYYDQDGYSKRGGAMKLSAVQDPVQGQKLLRIALNKTRFPGVFTAPFNLKGLKVQKHSLVRFSFAPFGWVNKLFRIDQQGIADEGGIQLILREEDASVYQNGPVAELPPPSASYGGDRGVEIAVAGMATAATGIESGTSAVDAIRVSWTTDDQRILHTEVRFRKTGEADWQTSAPLRRDILSALISPLLPNTDYEIQVRHISVWNVPGPWTSLVRKTDAVTKNPITGAITYADGTPIEDLKPSGPNANQTQAHIAAGFAGQGALATQNAVTWASQVTGIGKPADDATKSRVFTQQAAPTGQNVNDIWIKLNASNQPIAVSAWNGSIWQDGGNVTAFYTAAGIVGQGSLATQSAVTWATQVTGVGKPANDATKSRVFTQQAAPTGQSVNDIWVKLNGSNQPIAVAAWNGSAWLDGGNVTSFYTAAGIAGQGPLATSQYGEARVDNYLMPLGSNHIVDSDMVRGWAAFHPGWNGPIDVHVTRVLDGSVIKFVRGYFTTPLAQANVFDLFVSNPKHGEGIAGAREWGMPVQMGDRLFASALCAIAGGATVVNVTIGLYDGNGNYLNEYVVGAGGKNGYVSAAGDPSEFARVGGFLDVPLAEARWAFVWARVIKPATGSPQDAHSAAAQPMLAKVNPGQTSWPPYVSGPSAKRSDPTSDNIAGGIVGQSPDATVSYVGNTYASDAAAIAAGRAVGWIYWNSTTNSRKAVASAGDVMQLFASEDPVLRSRSGNGFIETGTITFTAQNATGPVEFRVTRVAGDTTIDAFPPTSVDSSAPFAHSMNFSANLSSLILGTSYLVSAKDAVGKSATRLVYVEFTRY